MTLTTQQPSKPSTPNAQIALAIDRYVKAATRDNTRRSYQTAIEHYESTWGGFLPATADQIASYLAHYAETLAANTLRQRLAAIAAWHVEQGFPDPTKAPLVKKVLKGIRELHPETPRSAKPLQIDQLIQLDRWLSARLQEAKELENHAQVLIHSRNRALILIGFWRGFRSDELCRMTVENTHAIPNQGITIFLTRSKGDRENLGTTYKTPALNQLCPVSAYMDWIEVSGLTQGPVFRRVNRWGHLSEKAFHPNSIIALLRTLLESAGIEDSEAFSSHSLRRGFASWASANQWDIKALMEYVGWNDVKSAMRYIESQQPFDNVAYLAPSSTSPNNSPNNHTATLEVHLLIQRYHKGVRTMKKTRETLERFCLKNYQLKVLSKDRTKYEIRVKHDTEERLDEIMDELLDEMHQIARDNQCLLDVSFIDKSTGRRWD